MERVAIDGVTVLWEDRPGPLAGMLSFGVGTLDEDLDDLGCCLAVQTVVTNLALPDVDADTDQGGGDTTSFAALGSPDAVGTYFTALCEALSTPVDAAGLAEVDWDDRVTDYLSDPVHTDPWAAQVARRLRACDRWPPPPLTTARVNRFRETWFVAGNAVLVLTGPPPDNLRLPLPPGSRPMRAARTVTGIPSTWYADAVRAPGLSFVVADPAGAYPAIRALTWCVDRELRRAGQRVECYPDAIGFAPGGFLFGLTLNSLIRAPGGDPAKQAEILWSQVRRFATAGPDQADLDEMRSRPAPKLPETLLRWQEVFALSAGAEDELLGYSVESDEVPQQTPLQMAAAAAALLPSAVMVVPYGTRPTLPGLSETSCWDAAYLPPGDEIRPPLLRRRSHPPRLVIATDSVSTVDSRGSVHTIPAADLLVLASDDGLWLAHTGHGCAVDVSAYASSRKRIEAVAEAGRRRPA
jgi:hypothetical protein